MTLIYHTFFAEYRGQTAQDVIACIHRDACALAPQSFEDWWAYQQKLWHHLYGITVPDAASPQAMEELLTILIKIGALEKGPAPASVPPPLPRAARTAHG